MSTIRFGISPLQVDTVAQFKPGIIVDDPRSDFPGNKLRYVRAQTQVAVGDSVRLDTGQTDEPGAVVPTSAGDTPVDGISSVLIPANSFGWITVQGRVPSAKVNAGVAAGAMLVSGAAAGTLFAVSTADATDASSQGRTIQALDAESGGLAEVYIF